ncbi:MAG: hypothetical protein HY720_06470, partial [Planctomycetes bacterium]|nr:hypothetical protein [Planctomycetota bacterium]
MQQSEMVEIARFLIQRRLAGKDAILETARELKRFHAQGIAMTLPQLLLQRGVIDAGGFAQLVSAFQDRAPRCPSCDRSFFELFGLPASRVRAFRCPSCDVPVEGEIGDFPKPVPRTPAPERHFSSVVNEIEEEEQALDAGQSIMISAGRATPSRKDRVDLPEPEAGSVTDSCEITDGAEIPSPSPKPPATRGGPGGRQSPPGAGIAQGKAPTQPARRIAPPPSRTPIPPRRTLDLV